MVSWNGRQRVPVRGSSPFKQVIVVKSSGSLDRVLDAIRRRAGSDTRVEEIEPYYWENGGWAIHLKTRTRLDLSDVESVKRSFTIK